MCVRERKIWKEDFCKRDEATKQSNKNASIYGII